MILINLIGVTWGLAYAVEFLRRGNLFAAAACAGMSAGNGYGLMRALGAPSMFS